MTTPDRRKPLSPMQRLKMFEAHGGVCVICKTKIIGKTWTDEHIRPLGLLGSNDMDNRGPAHTDCAIEKTKGDVSAIAKAKRVKAKHIGAGKRSTMPGSKGSGWRKRMDGTVERRT